MSDENSTNGGSDGVIEGIQVSDEALQHVGLIKPRNRTGLQASAVHAVTHPETLPQQLPDLPGGGFLSWFRDRRLRDVYDKHRVKEAELLSQEHLDRLESRLRAIVVVQKSMDAIAVDAIVAGVSEIGQGILATLYVKRSKTLLDAERALTRDYSEHLRAIAAVDLPGNVRQAQLDSATNEYFRRLAELRALQYRPGIQNT